MKYGIDSGWIVSETDSCTCGMGRGSVNGHEAFCGLEQECPIEEFDNWVKHVIADAYGRGHRDERRELWRLLEPVVTEIALRNGASRG